MINVADSLAVLTAYLPEERIEAELEPMFERKDRKGLPPTDVDLFGTLKAKRLDKFGHLG